MQKRVIALSINDLYGIDDKCYQMSRVNSQSDVEPNLVKMKMIQKNINRVNLQNQKLQKLFQQREEIQKLRDAVQVSNVNWKKMAVLAENVQQMHQNATSGKTKIRNVLGKYSEDVTKKLVVQIQNTKTVISNHEAKLKEMKAQHSNEVKKAIEAIRNKANQRISKIKVESGELIKKAEKEYSSVVEEQVDEICEEFQIEFMRRQNECRINLGHLENLISYYHYQKHREMLEDVSLSQMVGSNFVAIRNKVDNLEVKQKKIKSQVEWIKSRLRKQKSHHRKSRQTTVEPQQFAAIDELELGVHDIEYQMKGLDMICEELSKKQQKSLTQEQICSLIDIKQKLKNLRSKVTEFSSFYKQYF